MVFPASYTDSLYKALQALPEGYRGEIIAGRLHTSPRPAAKHVMVGSVGWGILDEPEVHFVRNIEVVVPDLAGWKRERMPSLPDDHRFEIVPDWVCEILSPGTATYDREVKMPAYAGHGVRWLWLIDPTVRQLQVYKNSDSGWKLKNEFNSDESISAPPFSEVVLQPPWS
jgi:Uma2 family endonuclease